jgi:hypothetical protein
LEVDVQSYTINEWCALRKVSRTEFYEMQKRGDGPRTYRVGRFQRISGEADRDWLAAREGVAA